MFRKIVYVVGILMSLMAAEGLNRFGSLVAAFRGADAGSYQAFLLVAIFSAGVFLAAFFNKVNKSIKWITFIALLICSALMLAAPAFPVNFQIITGLFISAIATLFIKMPKTKA